MSAWETTSSREVYGNPWIRVLEDGVRRPDGGEGIYGVVEVRQPAVFVVPVTDDGRILLVHLDRYTVGDSWEVPAGGSDGEDPVRAAARELREETGYAAASWQELGTQWALNGVARASARILLARGLSPVDGAQHHEEGISEIAAFSWDEIKVMLHDGRISDSETAGALLLAAIELSWT